MSETDSEKALTRGHAKYEFGYVASVATGPNTTPDALVGPALLTHVAVSDAGRSGWSVNFVLDKKNHVVFGDAGSSHFSCETFVPKGVTVNLHMNGDARIVLTYRVAQPPSP